MTATTVENKQNTITKLLTGNFRLVEIFWAGYMVVGFVLALIVSVLQDEASIIIGDSLNSIYLIIISVAVWNSASRDTGKKHWAIMAKISAVLITLSSLIGLGAWVYHLSQI
jgi:hypothetical protein